MSSKFDTLLTTIKLKDRMVTRNIDNKLLICDYAKANKI